MVTELPGVLGLMNIGVDMRQVLRELFWVIPLTELFALLGMIALEWKCIKNRIVLSVRLYLGQFEKDSLSSA